MGFTKLDSDILLSSIMSEPPETFKVWIAFLAACGPDGVARVSSVAISKICDLSMDSVRGAIAKLEGPDEESRSLNDEGKRIKRVDGGYKIINYQKYREKTYKETEAERKLKKRKGQGCPEESGNVRTCPEESGEIQEIPDTYASASSSASPLNNNGGEEDLPDTNTIPSGPKPEVAFEVFWSAYPNKSEQHSAKELYLQILSEGGATAYQMNSRAKDYDFYCRTEYLEEYPMCKYIKLAKNWLSARGWEEDWIKRVTQKKQEPKKPTPLYMREL
jgi:hypothetical protein